MQLLTLVVYVMIAVCGVVGLSNERRTITLSAFDWTDCGRSKSDPIFFDSINITPDPITIPGVATLNGLAGTPVQITRPIQAHVKVYKIISGYPIEIPCVNNVGSCDYDDVCALLDQQFDPSKPCPQFFQENDFPCHCPLPAKNYTFKNVQIPINGILPDVAVGDYNITLTANKNDDTELGCAQISLSLSQ